MNPQHLGVFILFITLGTFPGAARGLPMVDAMVQARDSQESYLQWSQKQAEKIGKSTRVNGQAGGSWDMRVIHTESSYNFKLRATWFTPEVIRATARYFQLRQGLTDAATKALVAEAESVGDTAILVEIDPREGSGVIPLDWEAYLRPKINEKSDFIGVAGLKLPGLRSVKVLESVVPRDYSYERFWVVFRLVDDRAQPLFSSSAKECELVIRIHAKEGRVAWTIPDSIRQLEEALAAKR
jgi:hypothetical protein